MDHRIEVLQEIEENQRLDLVQPAEPAFEAPVASRNGYRHHRVADDEALRLVHQVFMPNSAQPRSVVVFSGVDQSNGCSQISAAVAEILAKDVRRSVCLVEANFRSPAVSGLYGATNAGGFTDALTRKGPISAFAKRIDVPGNLWLLSCGTLTADSAGLLTSGSLRERIAELRAEFDYVIIDTPPLTQYADAIAVGQLADGLILIVDAGVTRRDQAAQVVANLRALKVEILGAVLNKGTSPVSKKFLNRF
jgi:capsular exopolysaccharide synthesis family protein